MMVPMKNVFLPLKECSLLEIMQCITEQGGEITQAASKIIRFGADSFHPDRPLVTNLTELLQEHADLIELMNYYYRKTPADFGMVQGKTQILVPRPVKQ